MGRAISPGDEDFDKSINAIWAQGDQKPEPSLTGRRLEVQRICAAIPRSTAGSPKTDGVSVRRPVEGWVSKNMRPRSQADADAWHGLFNT